MGRLNEFELTIQKVKDIPLTYEALIPGEYNFFQDVRRYQSIGPHMEIRVIRVDGRIELDADMRPVPIHKLSAAERKALVDYLTVRVARGDNIGSSWTFFRSGEKKRPVVAYGGNVVHNDTAVGQERIRRLLAFLEKEKGTSQMKRKWLPRIALALFLGGAVFAGLKYGHLASKYPFKSLVDRSSGPEIEFYQGVFPTVSQWLEKEEDVPFYRSIAEKLLNPDYISGMLSTMNQGAYRPDGAKEDHQGNRLILFTYFNYNKEVAEAIASHRNTLVGTEFMRLAKIYSCRQSGYTSNIFYFKVGDLDIKHAEISKYMKQNLISYKDFKKLRDINAFSELMEKDNISYKMKSFLENVYTFTPLRIDTPVKGRQWYLLTRTDASGALTFSAFFHKENATLIPKRIGNILLNPKKQTKDISWYALTNAQAEALKLSDNALTYFTNTAGHIHKLQIVKDKIKALKITPLKKGAIALTVHRELLMGDMKGKYGIQTHDPLTSLVISNLITKSSFEAEANLSLKRDPIQFNTTLVQLSKDDSFSVQSVTITPGTTNVIRLFAPIEQFKAKFADGSKAVFEKASLNLFNPFTFMISKDSITFGFQNDINGMEIDLGDTLLKIVKANDGNYQIVEAF